MMPEARIRELVKEHVIHIPSQAVQDFYNGPCAAVDIPTSANFEEIERLIRELIAYNARAA